MGRPALCRPSLTRGQLQRQVLPIPPEAKNTAQAIEQHILHGQMLCNDRYSARTKMTESLNQI